LFFSHFEWRTAQISPNRGKLAGNQWGRIISIPRPIEQTIVAFSKMLLSVTSNSFAMPKTGREYARIESKRITSGKMRSDIFPDSLRLNPISAELNMVLFILLGVLLVLFFLCISNFAISSMPIKSNRHEYPTLEQKRSTTTAAFRIRFVTLVQGVTKAIGTAFGRRPSGRKVTEPAAIALMTS
jgi:hypothetical protein